MFEEALYIGYGYDMDIIWIGFGEALENRLNNTKYFAIQDSDVSLKGT